MRLFAHWRLKLLLTIVVGGAYGALYFLVQRFPLAAPRQFPLTALDRAIPFGPGWVYIYESLGLPIGLVFWLAGTHRQIRLFVMGFVTIAVVSFAVFLVYPVHGPRPPGESGHTIYALLTKIDTPGNSFPSLHASLLVYAALFARRMEGLTRHPLFLGVLAAWTLLVLYATLATKQHYAIDIAAGAALAMIVEAVIARRLGNPKSLQHPAAKRTR